MKLQTNQRHRPLLTLLGVVLILGAVSTSGWYLIQHPPLEEVAQVFNWLDRYDIRSAEVQVEMLPTQLEVTTTIQIQPTQRSGRWLIFALNPKLSDLQADIGDQPVRVHKIWALRWITVPKEYRQQTFPLTLHYRGAFSSVSAEHATSYIDLHEAFLRTDTLWFPMQTNQELGLPEINCSFISPATASVITGGELEKTEVLPDQRKATYYKNLQAFQFVMGSQQGSTYHLGEHTLHLYLLPQYSQLADPIAHWALQTIQRYTEWFGPLPERFQEVTIVQETGDNYGVCDQNMIVLGHQFFENLTLTRNTYQPLVTDQQLYELISHEISHLWWNAGEYDLAALTGVQWYVEGMAEYTALLNLKETYQDQNMITRELEHKRKILARQKLKPMLDYTWWEYAIVPYYKGTLMFQGLHNLLGDTAFFEFMTHLYQIPDAVKTLDHLLAISAKLGYQEELTPFFQHWLLGQEPIDLQFDTVEQRSTGRVTELSLSLAETGLPKLEQPLTVQIEGANFREIRQLDPALAPHWTLTIPQPAYLIKIDPQGRYFDLDINNNRYWMDPKD